MSSIAVKLISVACVLALLMTGLQIMTNEVMASAGTDGSSITCGAPS